MEEPKALREQIIEAVEQLHEEAALTLAEQALHAGMDLLSLLEAVNEGMRRVGKLYEDKTYFIADLIMAGIIFKEVLELKHMTRYFRSHANRKIGCVVVGTVKGDLHDIGKDIFRGMMETNSFEVIDLGVDVPPEAFVRKVVENEPDILGLGGVLTYTTDAMKDVVDALTAAGLRDKVKIIIGGSHLTAESCRYVGADAYANDATFGAKICASWISNQED
ncbi:MAG: cobalamin-dependent protein [Syntrophomonadaceae bacterium]|nr:cobalamin-dependent protein [Syntrophomonadaceae bacterium]